MEELLLLFLDIFGKKVFGELGVGFSLVGCVVLLVFFGRGCIY